MSEPRVLSQEAAADVARLAKLFSHPLRLRLLVALASSGPGSATSMSRLFGHAFVNDCHYHLRILREGGLLKPHSSRKARGATERIYSLVPFSRWPESEQLVELLDVLGATGVGTPEATEKPPRKIDSTSDET